MQNTPKDVSLLRTSAGFGLMELVLVLGFIGLLAGGGWYAKTILNEATEVERGNNALEQAQNLQQMLDRQAGEQVNQLDALDKLISPPVQNSSIDISNWKTYRNEEYGFEFRYPQGWSSSEGNKASASVGVSEAATQGEGAAFHVEFMSEQNGHTGVTFIANPKMLPIDEWLADYYGQPVSTGFISSLTDQEWIMVGGEHAFRGRATEGLYFPKFVFIPHGTRVLFVMYDGRKIPRNEQIGDQILSTFKFTQAEDALSQPFRYSDQDGFWGTVTLVGYIRMGKLTECDLCAEFDYAYLDFQKTDSNAIYDFLSSNKGNSFVGINSVGLGCYQKEQQRIYSRNRADGGIVENIINGTELQKLLASGPQSPVEIRLTKPILTGGGGVPVCTSHFRNFKFL